MGKIKASLHKDGSPLRMGVLSAAAINWTAIFDPVQTHPGVVLAGVAARSLSKAEKQIADYQLTGAKAYGSYDALLADPSIDAVYIPLPNGLHAEWTLKALEAGKHVLLEKPFTSNADEARTIAAAAERSGKVLLEAFHWRFHPAAHRVKQLVESGEYGNVESVEATMYIPGSTLGAEDIRFDWALAGGASMDLTYVFSVTSHFASPTQAQATYTVQEAAARINAVDKRIDDAMKSVYTVEYPGRPTVTCKTHCDLGRPKLFGFMPKFWEATPQLHIELEKASIHFTNFVGPWLDHSIVISEKDASGVLTGTSAKEKCFKNGPRWGTRGERWWTTYRYQLEAFVERVNQANRNAEPTVPWVSLEESVAVMEVIDAVYLKAGLPRRGT